METLVLRIPAELAAELEAEARRLNITKSEVARRRLSVAGGADQEHGGFALIADLVGAVEGGPQDMSSRKKHYLRSSGYGRKHDR